MIREARDPILHLEPQTQLIAACIRHEIHIVADAIIDKVIWQECNLDVLAWSLPEIVDAIAKVNIKRLPEISKQEKAGLWIHIKIYAKKEVRRCYAECRRRRRK